MRMSRLHLDYLAFLVHKALKENKHIAVNDADAVVAIVRQTITENLKAEDEIEREAVASLEAHRNQILTSGADYQKMVRETKKMIARKRGLVL